MPQSVPVASLPMYDWPEVKWAHDALWAAIRERLHARGIAAPGNLDRARPSDEVWRDPGLVLSQTCAWPFIVRLRGKVRLVATPSYDVEGCAGALYSSFLVARTDETGTALGAFRGRRFAVNSRDSLSGYVALATAMLAEQLELSGVRWVETGGHRDSVRAVAEGAADLAAIDVVCWALAGRHETAAVEQLKVVGRTPLRPGLPFVTSPARGDQEIGVLRAALIEALASEATFAARQALFLTGFEIVAEADYAALSQLAV